MWRKSCLTAQCKLQNDSKLVFSCISLVPGPQPDVSILRITVCTISDNEGITIFFDGSDDVLDVMSAVYFSDNMN